MQPLSKLVLNTIRDIYTSTFLTSELGLPRCCLLLAMRVISGCDFFRMYYIECTYWILGSTYWKDWNIASIKKQNRRIDRYDRLRQISLTLRGIFLTLFRKSLLLLQCNMYVIVMKKVNQVQFWMNYNIA